MLERSYKAKRFDDALAQVKTDLGPDAVIVSTRQITDRQHSAQVEVRAIKLEDALRMGYGQQSAEALAQSPFERRLCRVGIPAAAARTIKNRIAQDLGEEPVNLFSAKDALASALSEEMMFSGPLGQKVRCVALVGPTGVGKTTTLAKLAAIAALVNHRRVAFVSLDQYRVGGTEQLGRYAELIGCAMEIAHDRRSLEISLRRLGQAELVLIDTAGRSPRDLAAIGELADCLHGVDEAVEVGLCLPAAIGDAEAHVTVDLLAPLRPTRLVSTKLDEAVFLGSIVGAQVMSGLPLAHFTTGQRVPEDIEVAAPERLAALLCGEDEEEER